MQRFCLILFTLACTTSTLFGQSPWDPQPKFFYELNVGAGEFTEKLNSSSLTANYPNAVNAAAARINFTESNSYAYNMQFGYYFDEKRTFGVGAGLLFLSQSGNIGTTAFHVEYEATDYKGNVFRQSVGSDNGIDESVKVSNLSAPLFLRYKKVISEDIFLTFDLGVVFNLLMQNKYSASPSFDYEAIYDFEGTGANLTTTYDNTPVPKGEDWLITKDHYAKENPNGDLQGYFNFLHGLGYTVGLDDTVRKSGTVNYSNKSVGFTFQPGINYKLTPKIYGKAGFYLLYQSYSNPANNNVAPLTSGPGDYNSLLNFTKSMNSFNYGIYFGINFYF